MPEMARMGRHDSCEGLDYDPTSGDAQFMLAGVKSMSVVSPVWTGGPPPVLIQALEPCPVPVVPHVSPVQYGMMHSSPVVQQGPTIEVEYPCLL
jgi:hypothetical protein